MTVPAYNPLASERTATLPLDELFRRYADFQAVVINTPNHVPALNSNVQDSIHMAIGLVTEAGEVLDLYKKQLYGKQKPVEHYKLVDECADVFFYLHGLMQSNHITFHDLIAVNVEKLSERYQEVISRY